MGKNKFLRTCISCNIPKNKQDLFKYVIWEDKIVVDFYQKINKRGFYTCKNFRCISNLSLVNIRKSLRKDINCLLSNEEILKILKENLLNDIILTLKMLNKAGLLIATTNKFIQEIKKGAKVEYVLVANDISINSWNKIDKFVNTISMFKFFNKVQLGEIFSKEEVSVIGLIKSELTKKIVEKIDVYTNIFVMGGL